LFVFFTFLVFLVFFFKKVNIVYRMKRMDMEKEKKKNVSECPLLIV
jgi:hypothetical protein